MFKVYKEKILCLIRRPLFIFIVSFLFYLCLGVCLSYYNRVYGNIYFGADNSRAAGDLMIINGVSHFRIKVHPLFLMIIQPITLLLDGIINNVRLTVVISGALVGAVSTFGIFKILSLFLDNLLMKLVLIGIYVFSFSSMLFSAIPESFMYASMFLVLYWLYISSRIKFHKVDKKDDVFLVFFGVISFGITLTNYVTYLIGFILILSCYQLGKKEKIIKFFKINGINGIIVIVLAYIQKLAWKGDTPFFLDSFLGIGASSSSFEETLYMDFSINLEKIVVWFQQVLVRPFIAGDIYFDKIDDIYPQILFKDTFSEVIVCIGFVLIMIILTIGVLRKNKHNRILWGMILSLAFNLLLHFVYGYKESFMYSPHFLFYTIIILGIDISCLKKPKGNLVIGVLGLFLIFEAYQNLVTFHELIKIIGDYAGTEPFSLFFVVVKVVFVTSVSILIISYVAKKIGLIKRWDLVDKDIVCVNGIWIYVLLMYLTTIFVWILNSV